MLIIFYLFACVWAYMDHSIHTEVRGQLAEISSPFHYVCYRNRTQVVSLRDKSLYSLSPQEGPAIIVFLNSVDAGAVSF